MIETYAPHNPNPPERTHEDITFYNKPDHPESISKERLAVTVDENGGWKLWKIPPNQEEASVKYGARIIGQSWTYLAFEPEMYPLPVSTRKAIALNVFRSRAISTLANNTRTQCDLEDEDAGAA